MKLRKKEQDAEENNDELNAPNDADVTPEDMQALGPRDGLNMDGGDDDLLRNTDYHFSGDDLDVPGAELDDENESIGEEDEENNSYSIGGDNHQDLEEDPTRI